MNRKPLIITISVALLIVISALGWYFYTHRNTPVALVPTNGGLPFGQGGGNVTPGAGDLENPSGTGLDAQGRPVAKLFRISDAPVAGAISFIKNGSTAVRYVDRATGHIYDVNPVTLEKIKITNNTLPRIYEAYFKNDGNGAVLRSLKDNGDIVENTVLLLTPPTASSTTGLYTVLSSTLRGTIGSMTVGNDNSLEYVSLDTGNIIKSLFNGEKPLTLFSSAFKEWTLSPSGSNTITTTKASASLPGYSYTLDSKGGLSKILGPLNALIVLGSKDGKHVAYSYNDGTKAFLHVQNLGTKETLDVTPVTLAEKCVWSIHTEYFMYCGVPVGGISGSEPDSWYQGSTHFSDRIWLFNTSTGYNDVLSDPKKDFNISLDIENPILSPDEDYLFFRNKNDQTLWALKLKQ